MHRSAFNAPPAFNSAERHSRRWLRLASVILAALMVLTSCLAEDESDQRRFANDPVDESVATQVPTEAPPIEDPPTEAPLASPETLLGSRGAPSTVYVQHQGELLAVSGDAEEDEARVITPDEASVLATDDSPSGHQVAVLAATADAGVSLFIVDPMGDIILEREEVLAGVGHGTPVPTDDEDEDGMTYRVAWAAQGEQVLVTTSTGHLVNVPFEDDPHTWELDQPLAPIMWAAWSPAGDQIAVLARDDDDRGRLYRVTPDGDAAAVSEVEWALNPDEASSIESAAWIADGTGLVAIEARLDDGTPHAGTLYELNIQNEQRTLISTPGAGGPAASITSFSIAPNGRAVAFVIALPTDESWAFNGLWIQSLRDERRYSVPVAGDVRDVSRVWWTSTGVAWNQATGTGDDENRALVSKSLEEEGVDQWLALEVEDPAATPVATPDATPLASPEATPVSSPQATPVSSPEATPEP